MTDTTIPHGFAPHYRKSPLTAPWEPIYSKVTDTNVILGLRIAEAHRLRDKTTQRRDALL